ncbi:MAG: protein-glutamate O-methyltransferase CheR [Candidatus Lokiarchaeota archaeon]|nr:protein-glutamate O-methyltransferase CheR [Candidatus Lokiarchaeota archaeon]
MTEINIRISEQSFQTLIGLLKEKTGLNLDYYRRTFILRRLKARMIRKKFSDLKEYNSFLLSNQEELKKFKDGFTIKYTYFFRDWDVYATFQNILLKCLNVEDIKKYIEELRPACNNIDKLRKKRKEMIEKEIVNAPSLFNNLKKLSIYQLISNSRKVKKPLTIWSCACATGEEPYSLAMLLDNLARTFPIINNNYQIVASDIDKLAISDAKNGIYSTEKLRNVPNIYEQRYFTQTRRSFEMLHAISSEIKDKVTFLNEDITKIHNYPWKFDIIFCRNLLIYFDIQNRKKFIRTIEKQLKEGGLLFLGKTETIFQEGTSLEIIDPIHHIYIKKN